MKSTEATKLMCVYYSASLHKQTKTEARVNAHKSKKMKLMDN